MHGSILDCLIDSDSENHNLDNARVYTTNVLYSLHNFLLKYRTESSIMQNFLLILLIHMIHMIKYDIKFSVSLQISKSRNS